MGKPKTPSADDDNPARRVIKKFGGQTALATLLGRRQSTIQHWATTGIIPAKWQGKLVELALSQGFMLSPDEFIGKREPSPAIEPDDFSPASVPLSEDMPKALYRGVLTIGDQDIPVYVLDNGMRVLSQRGAIKSIAGVDTGSAADYWGIAAVKAYLNKELSAAENIVFSIPGNPNPSRGVAAETFIDICQAYVKALRADELPTARQRTIATGCSLFLAACATVGLLALIDEATGYQYDRPEDALQVKLALFLEKEMRDWEKTFPDELWVQFGRLTNWSGAIHSRPKYWGILVNELIYYYLDADVSEWLRTNAPKPKHGQNYHQWLSSQYGLKRLMEHIWMVIGIASTCRSMMELKEKVAEKFGKHYVQVSIPFPLPGTGKN